MYFWLALLVVNFFSLIPQAFGACTSPDGVAGSMQYISSDFKFCDGSAWKSMTVSDTTVACTEAGKISKSGSDIQFCNGSTWISANGVSGGSTCSTAGAIAWKSATSRMEWCDGTDWKVMGVLPPDPCSGKSIGQACTGTTALYLGTHDGGSYMITPSGCTDSATPTCAGGNDTVFKAWRGSTGSDVDIPTLGNITDATAAAAERGAYATTEIVNHASVSSDSVADFCENMVYGGFSDWKLPSKSELAYIYCKSTPSSHSTSNPQDFVNCGGSGPSNQLTGFAAAYYWSTTEYDYRYAWITSFSNGSHSGTSGKSTSRYFRCIRRY
ncbi:MAG TPA: DUF1566 domain-containing protein [Bdellovibrionales bacterium]|nr:DUF1566 domain-containing protein [Bdellovibrionales bacterium]